MSAPEYAIRRADLALPESAGQELLERGFSGRLGTSSSDGQPYVVPLLYVCQHSRIFVHTGRAAGHVAANLNQNPKVCFVVDAQGDVYAYGRFECDSAMSYTSVMAFGSIEPVISQLGKQEFCELLMAKYGGHIQGRPAGFYPRLDAISVYAITVNRLTAKAISLPLPAAQWPAIDRTKTPSATPS